MKGNTCCISTDRLNIALYLLSPKRAVMFDSGLPADFKEIKSALDNEGIRPAYIVTSHVHYDHVGNHINFQNAGAKIWQSEFDAGITKDFTALGACFYTERSSALSEDRDFMVYKTDHVFSVDKEQISIEGFDFKILNIPGHAHSQLGFITPDNVAYLADALFDERTLCSKMLFHHDWSEAVRSLDKLSLLECDAYIVAHKGIYGSISSLIEKNREYFIRMADSMALIASDWMSREELKARMLLRLDTGPLSYRKFHLADRICNAAIAFLEDRGKLLCQIKENRRFYKTP